uniref:23S rRNA (adenine(2503)-C(2))-methyltransferase RlmN n=1 Tax=Eubacterium sp. TaxID=142586 RepID=UPI0040269FAF
MKKDIKSLNNEELAEWVRENSLPAFRAKQIFSWLHKSGVSDFSEMSNVSKDLRNKLSEEFYISSCEIENLFRLLDGEFLETVIMKYKYGYTICVSSQVGCKMGCRFCASTLAGFKRNLTAGEIESQLHSAQKDLGIRISHIVLMGIGEPLDNFDNVLRFIENVNSEDGLNISVRNITLSTCGIVPRIKDLMKHDPQLTLTISLHGPNDEIRSKIMPVNDRWKINEVIAACREYAEFTSRRVSFEYTLIKDVNDTPECAEELSKLLKGMLCHVNLIPVNNVEERKNIRSSDKSVNKFLHILQKNGINATIRRTLGSDINASCGQLRRKKTEVAQ